MVNHRHKEAILSKGKSRNFLLNITFWLQERLSTFRESMKALLDKFYVTTKLEGNVTLWNIFFKWASLKMCLIVQIWGSLALIVIIVSRVPPPLYKEQEEQHRVILEEYEMPWIPICFIKNRSSKVCYFGKKVEVILN